MDQQRVWKDAWKFSVQGQQELWTLHQQLREQIKARWDRHVPFADELFDRWERASYLGFGEGASIYDSSLVLGDVKVGEFTWIGPFTVLDGRGGLTIGRYCSISSGVQIYSHDTVRWALTGGKAPEARASTSIGDCCHIGALSIIGKGITVGDHCVIGASSFVNKNIEPFSIAVGTPARIVGRIRMLSDTEVEFVYEKGKS